MDEMLMHDTMAQSAMPPGSNSTGGNAGANGPHDGTRDSYVRSGPEDFELAYSMAERAGDAEAMADAVLGRCGFRLYAHRTVAGTALLQSRLRHTLSLLNRQSSAALQLRARAAAESDFRSGGHAEVLAVLDEARAAQDPAAIAQALNLAHQCLPGPEHGPLRRQLTQELIEQSFRTSRRTDLLTGLLWRTVDLFLCGDPHAERCLCELRELLVSRAHPACGYVADAIDVMLAIRTGHLGKAEKLADACAQQGAAVGDVDAAGWHAAQLVVIRWYQGRLPELLPMLTELGRSPGLGAFEHSHTAVTAVAAAMAGDRGKAASCLARLSMNDLGDLPRSGGWLATLNGVVEAAHLLADADTSARAYELLRPHAQLPVMTGPGIACFGSVHQALGVASLTVGETVRAGGHFRAAVQANLALGHWPAVAASQRMLAQTAARPCTRRLAAAAVPAQRPPTAHGEAPASSLQSAEDCGREPRRVAQAATGCERVGRSWRITWGRRSTLVKHSIGMYHLAVLIANPGREIPALELVAGLATLRDAVAGTAASSQPLLDREAVQNYRKHLQRLRSEIDELEPRNDLERAEAMRSEYDWLVTQLAGATGFGGRPRRFSDDSERARIAVGKAIRRALSNISHTDLQIGEHLRQRIHTGVRCSFWPA